MLVGFRARPDRQVRVRSLDLDAEIDVAPGAVLDGWGAPVAATLALFAERAPAPLAGFDAAITSTVPIGAGLASSAAFEIAVALAVGAVNGLALDPIELPRASAKRSSTARPACRAA